MYQRVRTFLVSRGRGAASGIRLQGSGAARTSGAWAAGCARPKSHLYQRVEWMSTSSDDSSHFSAKTGAGNADASDSAGPQAANVDNSAFHPHTYLHAVRIGDVRLLQDQLDYLKAHNIHQSFLPTALKLTRMSKFLNYLTLNKLTALHIAAGNGSVRICEMLIDAGADVNAIAEGRHTYGETPIFSAIRGKSEAVVRYLLKQGAKVTIVDRRGRTPRSEAVHANNKTVIAMITEAERSQTNNATYPGGCNLFTSYVAPPYNLSEPVPGASARDHRFLTPPLPDLLRQLGNPLSDLPPHATDLDLITRKAEIDSSTYRKLIELNYIAEMSTAPPSPDVIDPDATSFDLVGVCTNVNGTPYHDLTFTLAPIHPPDEPKRSTWRTPSGESVRISVLVTSKNKLGLDRDLCNYFMECIRAKKRLRIRSHKGSIVDGKVLSYRLIPDHIQILISERSMDRALGKDDVPSASME